MTKRRYIVVLFLAAIAALCLAVAVGAGCKKNKTYEVKFDTGDHAKVESIYAEKDEVITLPSPEDEEWYVFEAWYQSSDFSGARYVAASSYTVTGKTTFYGKYNSVVPIYLDLDGGTLEETSFILEVGKDVLEYMSQYEPVKDGYEFDHWELEDGNTLKSGFLMPDDGLTLKAIYNVRVLSEVWVWDDETCVHAEHYEQYDLVQYRSIRSPLTTAELIPTPPSGLLQSSEQSTDGGIFPSVADADYKNNVCKIYYDKQDIVYSFDSNYPAETGLSSGTVASGECVFGDFVEAPTDLTCYGYILVGWTTIGPDEAVPEYTVDLLTPNTMVYDSSVGAYVARGGVETAWCMPEEQRTTFFAVWYRGYFDMFGSYDVVYDFGGGDTVYLSRGGVFWESQPYSSSDGYYSFINQAEKNAEIYRVTLKESGYFVFYDPNYILNDYYRVTAVYMEGYDCMVMAVEDEYFYFTASGNVEYVDESGTSYGTYDYDEDGYSVINFIQGPLSGKTYSLLLVTLDDAGSEVNGFIVREDDEADRVITFGGIGYDADGGYGGVVSGSDYYVWLSGYSTCIFYIYGETYSYYYVLAGDDTLMLFSTTYSDSYYGYPLGAIYRYSSDFGRWLYYYSALDTDLTIYSEDKTEVIGTVTLDGVYRGTVSKNDGTTYDVIFTVDSYAVGDVVMLFAGGTYYYDYWTEVECYVYDYEDNGDYTYTYFLTAIPGTYSETYFYDGDEEPSSYQIFGIDTDSSTVTLYLYGYSMLASSYIYFSVWTGNYTAVTDPANGLTYYKVKNITATDDYDFYLISDIYAATYSYAELCAMTEVGFVTTTYAWADSEYTYSADVNIWYYYKTGSDETRVDLSKTYSGNLAIATEDGSFEGTATSLIVLGDYLVYGTFTDTGSVSVVIEGYVSDRQNHIDENMQAFTVYVVSFSYVLSGGNDDEDGISYEEDVYIEFGEDGSFTVPDNLYQYYFAYGDDGPSSGEYIYYDLLGDAAVYTYVSGGSTYTGTVTTNGTFTSTGKTVYTFTSDNQETSFMFVFDVYTDENGREISVFVKYDREGSKTYKGQGGSTFVTDGTGYGASFTIGGVAYGVDYTVVESEGYYNNGYITFATGGTNYILDLTAEGSDFDYTVRGQEYWYMFYVIDNQVLKSYYMTFDGYDKLTVYTYDGGTFTPVGSGDYSVVDTVVTYGWSYDLYTATTGYEYTGKGVLDYVAGDAFAILYVDREEYSMTFVDSSDFSVYILDGYGDAFRYTTDGDLEYGQYTVLDDEYLYYVSEDEETVIVYGYTLTNGVIRAIDYGEAPYIYYNGDMTMSLYLTDYGRLTYDSDTYSYYVRDGGYIYIYYIPGDETLANGFGYSKSEPIYLGNTIALNNETYTYLRTGVSYTLKRAEGDEENYGALARSYDATKNEYADITYLLGDITFIAEASDEYYADGTITLKDGDGNPVTFTDGDGNEMKTISMTFARESAGDGAYVMTFDMYAADYSEVLFYSYDDTFLYTLEITFTGDDGTGCVGTYKVTQMDLYVPMLSFETEYLVYEADNYYGMFEYYWYIYQLGAMVEDYDYDAYYAAYECYTYAEYLYELSDYYYSELYLIYNYDEDCEFTGELFATCYFMPYLIADADGNEITFDRIPVSYTSEGYYVSFVGGDGITYTLTFLQNYTFIDMEYSSIIAFDTVAFQWIADYYTTAGVDGNSYRVTTGTLIYSDYYYDYEGEIWSIGLTLIGSDGEETVINALVMFDLDGSLYFVEQGTDGMTVYYKITYSFDADGEVSGIEVEKTSSDVKTYTYTDGEGNILYVDVYEYSDGSLEFLLVYGEEVNGESTMMYYRVTEAAVMEDGSYLVTLTGGAVYVISLPDSGTTIETMAEVDVIFTTEIDGEKCIIAEGEGGRVYYEVTYDANGNASATEASATTCMIGGAGSLDMLGSEIVLVYFSSDFTDGGGVVTASGYYLVEECDATGEGTYTIILTDGSIFGVTVSGSSATLAYEGNVGDEEEADEEDGGEAEGYSFAA